MLPCAVPWKPEGRWEGRGGWRQARSLAVNQSPAFDVGPGLTPGQPLATARRAVGCSAFLGAIYASGGRRGKFLLWGRGWGEGAAVELRAWVL